MSSAPGIEDLLRCFLRAAADFRIPREVSGVFRRLVVDRVRDFAPDSAARLESMSWEEFRCLAETARAVQENC